MEGWFALHEPGREYAYPLDRCRLALRLRVPRRSALRCRVRCWNRNLTRQEEAETEDMIMFARDGAFDYFEAVVSTPRPTRYILYYFQIDTRRGTVWKHAHGVTAREPDSGFYEYCYTNDGEAHIVPDWARGAVYYHVFPDRFANGDPDNDPPGAAPWGSPPTREQFMGGDLRGIMQRLPYLSELGVDILYLNPIFLAPSNHKYDTTDYMAVDPHFGDAADVRALADECHRRGMRLLLDGVFHHCGFEFAPFQDVVMHGPDSPYARWFYIESFPVDPAAFNYEMIGYFWRMPKLRLSDPDARAYMLGVAVHWLKTAGIDGWRIDVAEEVDYTFLQRLRAEVKAVRPDALLLGEAWRENRDLLRGDRMDSLMNYVFRDTVVDFFGLRRIGARDFDARLNALLAAYPSIVRDGLYNLLGSHDTARFLTVCGGDVRVMKLAVAFQFCFPGSPAIYYGDEVGMDGESDPDCRKAMEWEAGKQCRELLVWYKRWIGLRKAHRALARGGFVSVCCGSGAEEGVYGFIREAGDATDAAGVTDAAGAADADADDAADQAERLYCVFNRSDTPAVVALPVVPAPAPGQARWVTDLLSGRRECIRTPEAGAAHWNDDIACCRGVVDVQMMPYEVCLFAEKR